MTKVHARTVLTSEGWQSDLELVVAKNGRIASIGPQTGKSEKIVDVLLPAPTNLHSHSFQRIIAGLTEARGPDARDSFWTWRKLMYGYLQKLSPEHIEAIAAQVFMEMAEAGYAAVVEFHYLHHSPSGTPYENITELAERIAGAAQEVGLGITLLPVQYEFGGCDGRAPEGGQLRFGNSKDQFAKLYAASEKVISSGVADWKIGVAPHSLRAVDADGLKLASALTKDGPFHMHLAEQVAEVDEVQSYLGARPVEWVLDNMAVDARNCFIHCTQMTAKETANLAASGAVAGLCPITESSLGDGIFDGANYLRSSGAFGIGSDSNIQISLWDELKTLEYSQRLRERGRAILATPSHSTGRVLFENALIGGAQAAGRSSGALKPGMWADMIGISTKNEFLSGRKGDILLDSLIFSGNGQKTITDVWSAGRHIVKDGRHIKRSQIVQGFISTMKAMELET